MVLGTLCSVLGTHVDSPQGRSATRHKRTCACSPPASRGQAGAGREETHRKARTELDRGGTSCRLPASLFFHVVRSVSQLPCRGSGGCRGETSPPARHAPSAARLPLGYQINQIRELGSSAPAAARCVKCLTVVAGDRRAASMRAKKRPGAGHGAGSRGAKRYSLHGLYSSSSAWSASEAMRSSVVHSGLAQSIRRWQEQGHLPVTHTPARRTFRTASSPWLLDALS